MSIADRMATGRLVAQRKAPYFKSLIQSLVPHETPDVSTIGITKTLVLFFNAEWLDTCSPEQIAGLYWHEGMHIVLGHHERRGDRDPLMFNIAGDIFINDQGRNAGFQFPPGGMFPELFGFPKNLTSDEYYALLLKMGKDAAKQKLEDEQGGEGGEGEPDPKKRKWSSGQCGSGAGNGQDSEPDGAAPEVGGRSEAEVRQSVMRVAEAVKAEAQKGRGNMPCGLDRWADEALKPAQIPWQTKLSRALRQCVNYRPGAVDYSYSRLSRRQAGVGFGVGKPILPALVRPVPRVAFVLDTSGSMGTDQLNAGLAECQGILAALGADVTFISCDAAVHAVGKVSSTSQMKKLVKGGGGTDFNPAFEYITAMRPRPEVVIFATDGDGWAPKSVPPYRVLWLLIDSYCDQPPVPWGEPVVVSTRERAT